MKKFLSIPALLLLSLAHGYSASLVIIDASTLNGSFESGTGNVPTLWQTGLGVTEVYRFSDPGPTPPQTPNGVWAATITLDNHPV